MAVELSQLSIVVRAKADQIAGDIEKGIRRAQGSFTRQGQVIGTALATGIAGAMGTVAMAFKNGVKQIDDLSAAASKIGASGGGLAQLQFQAKMADASFEGVLSSMQKMSANIATGGATSALGKLKLDAAEIRKMAPEQQFEKIREALRGVSDVGARMALGKEIFGKGFGEIVNLIKASSAETAEWNRIAEVLGLTFSDKVAAAVDQFDKQTNVIVAAWDGFSRQIAGVLAPEMLGVSNILVQQVDQWGGMEVVATKVAGVVMSMVGFIADCVSGVEKLIKSLVLVWTKCREVEVVIIGWGSTAMAHVLRGIAEMAKALARMVTDNETQFRSMINTVLSLIRTGVQALIDGTVKAVEGSANAIRSGFSGVSEFFGGPALAPVTLTAPKVPEVALPAGVGQAASAALLSGATVTGAVANSLDDLAKSQEQLQKELGQTSKALEEDIMSASYGQKLAAQREANKHIIFQSAEDAKIAMVDVNKAAANAGKTAADTHKKTVEDFSKNTTTAFSQMQSANQAVVTDMVSAWITGTGKMSDIINQWAQQSLKRIIDVLLFGTRGGAGGAGGFGGVLGAVGGMGGGWGGAVASVAGALFGGARASGGPVAAGRSYVVGERGPEMFMPKQSGNIMPGGIKGGGGGTIFAPIINQTFAPGVSRVELAVIADQLQRETIAAVAATYEQGGSYRRRMKG